MPWLTSKQTLIGAACLVALAQPSTAAAETGDKLWRIGADIGGGGGLVHLRQSEREFDSNQVQQVVLLDLHTHYIFATSVGLGLHLGGMLLSYDGQNHFGQAASLDIGPSVMLRQPWRRGEFMLRLPFGASIAATQEVVPMDIQGRVVISTETVSNAPGLGLHAGAMIGAQWPISGRLELRLETGVLWRSLLVDETSGSVGPSLFDAQEERRSYYGMATWTISVGMTWDFHRQNRVTAGDSNGPNLVVLQPKQAPSL